MGDLVAAFGLALAMEGLLFASCPEAMRRMMLEAAETPRETMRIVGLVTALLGVAILWVMRRVLA